MSAEKHKSSHVSDLPHKEHQTTAHTEDSTSDNPFHADEILNNRTYRPYPSKYGAIFAQLATRERMEREGVRELEEEREAKKEGNGKGKEKGEAKREKEEKGKGKQEEEEEARKGGGEGRKEFDEGEEEQFVLYKGGQRIQDANDDDEDDDDGWETVDYSEEKMDD